ncbi:MULTISPECIES: hypothetical protein [unclassified Streptomyces]|uniref:hypothetical protein n=1 Tax=unclassified Streptomyces TaxID=2593676 RepID=UPI00224FFABC|nr:hypothetical protein [Streptomyces sp. NBC_00047]MCX5613418.1 hypothetical protein [Streptomyces sp. NBC_00047]
MQRRATARRRGAPALAAQWPAYFIAFDVLQAERVELVTLPYKEHRWHLEVLFTTRALSLSF